MKTAMKLNYKKTAIFALFMPFVAFAESVNVESVSESQSAFSNPLFLTLLGVLIVLAILIAVLASVVFNILKFKLKTMGEKSKSVATALAIVLMFHSLDGFSASFGGIHSTTFWIILTVIAFELFIVSYLVLVLYRIISPEKEKQNIVEVESVKEQPSALEKIWQGLNDSVEIEKEKDILLDHDYDGIKELDNNLPPWWKYGFYISIIFAVFYLYWFHAGGKGLSSEEELQASITEAEIELAAYREKAKDLVDENTVTLLSASEELLQGKERFTKKCAVCHGPEGQGSAMAPNLTDDYWLHGGAIGNIFATIKYGVAGKGMQSWKNEFSPKEIAQIASYIKSIHGSNPANAWEPQGELFKETEGDSAESTSDSTQNSTPEI